MSIRISQKHGVNPSMSRCIICGGPGNDVLLMGRLPGDQQAPRIGPVTSIEPCRECREKYLTEGVMLVEMDGIENKRGNPTGRINVVKLEAFTRAFNVPIPKERIAMLSMETWKAVFGEGK